MSRRSVLLATTFSIAIGSLAAVGPASAHGFGGGGSFAFRSPAAAYIARAPMMGNYDSGRFGHAPSMGSPASQSNSAGIRLQPSHIPAVANAPLGNGPAVASSIRPAQLSPTITSSGNGIQRPSIDAAGIVRPNDSVTNQIKDISAAEGRGKLPKSGLNNDVPNVAGPDATIMGQGQGNGVQKVPGVKIPDGPAVNLPGSQFGQKGPRQVPGFGDGTGGAATLNLPGTVDRHGPDDASKKLGELEKPAQQLLNDATKGGVNSLNTSAGLTPGERESDRFGAESGANAAAASFVNTGRPVQPLVNTGTPVNVSTSKGSDGNGGTVSITNVTGPNTDRATIVHTTKDGKTTTQTTTSDPKTGEPISVTKTTTGGDGKKNTPNDDSSNSHDIGALSPNSAIGRRGQGGGTDNNGTESSGGQGTQLAPGSAQGRRGNGDGTGTHGDNNQVGNDGTLAAGTSLARKNNGDGGGSDTRDGGTSLGAVKVHPGGNPSQSNLKAAAAMGD